ncbi:MAG: formylglycine-generating enzyme family protein [Treponema sp.]|nr:formylglycine-generating enzyme family protein [Treponema sp.]
MKKMASVFLSLVCVFLCAACFSPWKGDSGTFSIGIGGSGNARFLTPEETALLDHTITLQGPGPEQVAAIRGARTVDFSVEPGLWTISVKAFRNGRIIAQGSRSVEIKPGPNGVIEILMVFVTLTSSTGIEMMPIPAGNFLMGSPANEPDRASIENYRTVNDGIVTMSGYWMSRYQITQEQYEAVMNTNPSAYSSGGLNAAAVAELDTSTFPVERVSWYDALVFCNKLSEMEGLTPAYEMQTGANPNIWSTDPVDWGDIPIAINARWDAARMVTASTGYRLPTEAQWEYACRAGTTTAFNTGSNTISDFTGWYNENSGAQTHQVGLKPPNAWGLYDMHGNVWEWCWDWFENNYLEESDDPVGPSTGTQRVYRGGSWENSGGNIRSAVRFRNAPTERSSVLGFRIVLPL